MTPEGIFDLLDRGGVVALLVYNIFVVTVGAYRKWWTPGWYPAEKDKQYAEHRAECRQENDKKDAIIAQQKAHIESLRETAIGSQQIARQAVRKLSKEAGSTANGDGSGYE